MISASNLSPNVRESPLGLPSVPYVEPSPGGRALPAELGPTLGVGLRRLLLRRRAGRAGHRATVVLVPPFLGTRLKDSRGRMLWGETRRLFFGPSITGADDARPAGLLEELPLIPGLYAQDVFGGMMRLLTEVGGYRRGEDLFTLDYDWRTGVADAASRLAALIEQIRGIGSERIDLVCVSSGGAIGRYYLAYGGTDGIRAEVRNGGALFGASEVARPGSNKEPTWEGATRVRRVVYIGAPQRGTFGALAHFDEGIVFAPGGKCFPPPDLALCQTGFDFLPHPDDPVFVDGSGHPLALSLYEVDTWIELGLASSLRGIDKEAFAARLGRAKRLHRALDRASRAHPDSIVIGARHLPTRARIVVSRGRAVVPPCCPGRTDPLARHTYVPGDGSLPEASMRAVPGLPEGCVWLVQSAAHHLMPADPDVHRLLLEALLATDRPLTTAARGLRAADSLSRSSGQ